MLPYHSSAFLFAKERQPVHSLGREMHRLQSLHLAVAPFGPEVLENLGIEPITTHGGKNRVRHTVRIHVRRRTAILQIPLAVLCHGSRNADGRAAIANASTELAVVTGLMETGQAALVACTIHV